LSNSIDIRVDSPLLITFTGNVIDLSALQPSKAESPISLRLLSASKSILMRPDSSNARSPILLTLAGNVIFLSSVQPLKALSPISLRLLSTSKSILMRPDPENASAPIVCTLAGIVIVKGPSHLVNALSEIFLVPLLITTTASFPSSTITPQVLSLSAVG